MTLTSPPILILFFEVVTLYIISSIKFCAYSMVVCQVNDECTDYRSFKGKITIQNELLHSSNEHCSLTALRRHE